MQPHNPHNLDELLHDIWRQNELVLHQQNIILHQHEETMSALTDLQDKVAEVATNVRDRIAALEAANAAAQTAANDALVAAGVSEAARAAVQTAFDAQDAGIAAVTTSVDAMDDFSATP